MNKKSSINEDIKLFYFQLYSKCYDLKNNVTDLIKGNITDDDLYCPKRFDGFACWNRTRAGTVVYQNCPGFVTGFDNRRIAHKTCLENGSWFAHPETGDEWSNYTNCVDVADLEFRQFVNSIYATGYTVSLVTLVVSLCIFFSFRSLKCTRIRIHIQLFVSLALTCLFWIIWYKFLSSSDTIDRNSEWCISYYVFLQYLMLTNYFWMFCEGLHLHLVLVVVFVKDAVAMRWFLTIGWISPIIWTTIYVFVRGNHPTDNISCWSSDSVTMWIITAPVMMSLIASMIFLVNVVRVLLTKLHPCSAQPAPLALRKAARATLILVPLFGLHHILFPFRPNKGTTFEKYYQVASAFLVSLQGVCVACLFCFANHDVVFAVRNFIGKYIPNLLPPTYGAESNNAPGATQSRDVIV